MRTTPPRHRRAGIPTRNSPVACVTGTAPRGPSTRPDTRRPATVPPVLRRTAQRGVTMPTANEMRAAVTAYVDASNHNDKEAVLAMFAPDATWFDPVGAPPHE